ncbi:hypothetical protein [Leuconostoc falkenbergense]|uniref:hypothetical protein n=1 Tax=Leuconostoc falkenbergense TaxID=2766470 RepID=UPI001FC8C17F|nr:hypothetical protein [Leuconostoc falkenbergense]
MGFSVHLNVQLKFYNLPYYKIGKATHSQQIARLDSEYREQIPEIIAKIRKETGLTVNTNI